MTSNPSNEWSTVSEAEEIIERLTRELEIERMCHESASRANHDHRVDRDRLREAIRQGCCGSAHNCSAREALKE